MKIFWFILISIAVGFVVNFCASILLSRLLKRNSAFPERIRISSIDDANLVLRWTKRKFSSDEKSRLWADAMNILMTADSYDLGKRYFDKALLVLGEDGEEFRQVGEEVLHDRFPFEARRPDEQKRPCKSRVRGTFVDAD